MPLDRRLFLRRMGIAAGAVASLPLLWRVRALAASANPLKIVIVGGGLAGLSAAYELQQLGHKPVILEAERKHVGGRARTLRFDGGLYGEAGAMRIPSVHDLVLNYAKELGVPLRPFVFTNPMAWALGRGKKVRFSEIASLGAAYDLKGDEAGKTPDDLWAQSVLSWLDRLTAAEKKDMFRGAPTTSTIRDLDRQSLGDLWHAAGMSPDAREFMAVFMAYEQFGDTAALEHLREEQREVWTSGFHEVVGGTDVFPAAFAEKLKSKPRMGCEVFRIQQDGDGVAAIYRRKGETKRVTGDYMICTLPFTVLNRIEVDPAFTPGKQRAIRELHYDSAVKTLAITNRRFWETDDGIYGGGSVTDLMSGSTYYPSDNATAKDPEVSNGPGVMLASYTWGDMARKQSAMPVKQRTELVLDRVAELHPQLREPDMIRETAAWSWESYRHAAGAYAFFMPGQQTALYDDMVRPEGRIFIAGEHASFNHSWMQGAIESGLRAVHDITAAANPA